MGDISNIAKEQIHSGPTAETFRVRVAGRSISSSVESVDVTYSGDGTSEATINTWRSLNGFENAEISVDVGYGELLENYFTGKIGSMQEDSWGGPNEIQCWGPFKLMADQVIGEQVNYKNMDIVDALMDLVRRAKYQKGKVEVMRGAAFPISGDNAVFVWETKLGEAANTLAGAANYVFADLPGGRRLIRPKPRPGTVGQVKERYNESHFPPGGFTATPSNRSFYASVRVFRRNDNGTLEVDAKRPIGIQSRFRPPVGRVFVVPDFVGTQQAAEREATITARALSRGVYDIELSGLAANPELAMYDTIQTRTTEIRERGDEREWWTVTYNWLIDGSITLNCSKSGNLMTLTGAGVIADERLVRRETRE